MASAVVALTSTDVERCNDAPNSISTKTVVAELADAIPPHPLGVKPLGNRYLAETSLSRDSVGTLAYLPDELLMIVLEYLGALQLTFLGSTCRFLYAFCHSEELWRALFLRLDKFTVRAHHQSVVWRGSWRATLLGLSDTSSLFINCGNVYSDVLHRPYACSQIDLKRFASSIPNANRITRLAGLSTDEFAREWANRPFLITDGVRDWPAWRDWDLKELCHKYGDVRFRAEAVDWPFTTYYAYMASNQDESPLYLFDRKFVEKMGLRVGDGDKDRIGAAYWKPACFGTDLFEVLGDDRPAHRWLIVGPSGSGSTFHKDPNGTSAWNAVVRGSKYWIMFPPKAVVPGVYVSRDGGEVTSPLSIAEWLLGFHAEARALTGCVEAVCGAGEVVHVPSGWWHLVVNLEPGVAVTQNFVPLTPSLRHLRAVLEFLRDRPNQVTGFCRGTEEITDPYALLVRRLGEVHPGLVEEALSCQESSGTRKRKWEDVVGSSDSGSTGFSFGFADSNEDLEEEDDGES